ncbi:reverse transcriptase [Fusarium albosuccineum]|uniref:Reverse transcriptase n=1 Tax=Fusarium albosuccineum TaxID=1237068 RepID=A0A8H4KHX2_9HYPO|nr:reverse transcriptase [Fusarium albosuccineum]
MAPGRGVNQSIPDSWLAIEYMNIDDVYDQVVRSGPGYTVIKKDIKDTFRIVPHLRPVFYVNHNLDDLIAIKKSPSMSDTTSFFNRVYNVATNHPGIPRNTKKDEQGTCVTVLGI